MFQLIVAVISIALVAVLAIASTYYGGTAFTQSQQKAQITALVNAGEQIAGANALYFTDWGANAVDVVNVLVSGGTYLASKPVDSAATTGNDWTISGTDALIVIKYTGAPLTTFCTAVATQAGVSGGPYLGALGAALPTGDQFGCIGTAASATFNFRL